jgi:2-oxoglutarate ferredoxin oxidoreductase subunit delta
VGGGGGGVNAGSGLEPIVTRGTLVIDVEACKGCELCIDACPPHVLVMTDREVNARGYRYPELLPGCIACQACTAICPDFVFQVYRYAQPVESTAAAPEVGHDD